MLDTIKSYGIGSAEGMERTAGTEPANALLPVTMAIADYDRTRPLLDGRVKPAGIDLKTTTASIPEFCLVPVYEQYDFAEMSLSWYLMAHCRNEPVVALPVFPLRMPVHAYIYCRANAPYTHPLDLAGKRIGTKRYRSTINVWLRGILQEYHGLRPQDFTWITPAEEGAGFVIPEGVSVTVRPGEMADIEELLFKGEIDALFTPVLPDAVLRGDPRIRRLYPDCRSVSRAYSKQTGFLPMTHTVVMSKRLWEREPWVAERLFSALTEAQRQCLEFSHADPKHSTFCETVYTLEEERAAYGADPWAHGVAANRAALETFIRYAHEQGYIPRRPAPEDVFASNTVSL
jgi:4,5-dihydroxyphthalate decarboxylase